MKAARVILILCFLAACVEVAVRYGTLPPWMASQFGAGGEPKGWMAKPNFFALFLGMQLLLVVLFVVLPRWLGRLPVNLPHRDYWLAPERDHQASSGPRRVALPPGP